VRTQVGIVGAGPAGLLLSHLLHLQGIASVVLDNRSREEIERTIRAGVLEQGTVDLLTRAGLGERLAREALFHRGVYLRFAGRTHHIDMQALTGGRVTIYPQHEVLKDLIRARIDAGGEVLFEAQALGLEGIDGSPVIAFAHDGRKRRLACDFIAGCDGSHGICGRALPEGSVTRYERAYRFAWLGILVEAPPSSDELVYAAHARGFALISTRAPTLQRMYLQCEPGDRIEDWPDERIWAELRARTAAEGWTLEEGRIAHKVVVGMRSSVAEPMQHGRLLLAGDAAHVVPPTGAKGLNLAVADVEILAHAFARHYRDGDPDALARYSAERLPAIWKGQRFSWWMTTLLHRSPGDTAFDERRRLAELDELVASPHLTIAFAQGYLGVRPLKYA
jgi:p-hydroxybenzoate 3-monooxygenase